MARSGDGVTDHIAYNNIEDPTAGSFTFSCWIYPTTTLQQTGMIWVVNLSGDTDDGILLYLVNNVNIDLAFQIQASTANMLKWANGSSGLTLNAWNHIICDSDGSATASGHHIYVGNVEPTYDTVQDRSGTLTGGGGKWTVLGRTFTDTAQLEARIADCGYWPRVLSVGERAMLTARYSPHFIQGLLWGPDLIRSQRDYISGQAGTLDGTSVVEHPNTIYRSSSQQIFVPGAVVGGGIRNPLAGPVTLRTPLGAGA